MSKIKEQKKKPDYYIFRRGWDICLYHVATRTCERLDYETAERIPSGSKITIKAGRMPRVQIASILDALGIL